MLMTHVDQIEKLANQLQHSGECRDKSESRWRQIDAKRTPCDARAAFSEGICKTADFPACCTDSTALRLAPVPVQEPVYRYKGVGRGLKRWSLIELDRDTLHTRLGSAHECHSGVRLVLSRWCRSCQLDLLSTD
uniref:Uncharacterized protein n=1 Tax=Ananas comosus var. bracteatus TaxID=296719 RepID=A0A6V7P179_ANACO|nr:unnamed protein product [Ananas comosus var. bracteatus]